MINVLIISFLIQTIVVIYNINTMNKMHNYIAQRPELEIELKAGKVVYAIISLFLIISSLLELYVIIKNL